jgi:hypothetical protein
MKAASGTLVLQQNPDADLLGMPMTKEKMIAA